MDADAPLLAVDNLTITLPAGRGRTVDIVENVSFRLDGAEIMGLVGESGSGKSMSALAIMGLIDAPGARIAGSIRFRGRELIGLDRRALRALRGAEIAMIFQDPMTALTPVHTVGWQIDEQLRAHQPLSRAGARARTVELLGEMGVPDPRRAADRYPHQLSGGLRQRAMIAMALSCNPSLLIADEPTTALDVTVQAQILDLLRRLRQDFGSSILLITHDMGVVAETCDRTTVLYSGNVAEHGPTDALFRQPAHPYTAALLDSIPPLRGTRPRRLPSIPGAPPAPSARPPGCPFQPRCAYGHVACETRPSLLPIGAQQVACVLPAEGRALPPRAVLSA
ncbi:ABC transporter ATP-binding protein [Acetobacteraceae bacterium KSS8]|uniref:ABC transporter ATP-binding protein n=1 Tax=Endosaccharibacter trunci TaxID=2812733 RepID=A0ABT1W400_9PROT|nr:ABC transporter ATP-binding protein [Acetobacteraceae bacterium KSS8]